MHAPRACADGEQLVGRTVSAKEEEEGEMKAATVTFTFKAFAKEKEGEWKALGFDFPSTRCFILPYRWGTGRGWSRRWRGGSLYTDESPIPPPCVAQDRMQEAEGGV